MSTIRHPELKSMKTMSNWYQKYRSLNINPLKLDKRRWPLFQYIESTWRNFRRHHRCRANQELGIEPRIMERV